MLRTSGVAVEAVFYSKKGGCPTMSNNTLQGKLWARQNPYPVKEKYFDRGPQAGSGGLDWHGSRMPRHLRKKSEFAVFGLSYKS